MSVDGDLHDTSKPAELLRLYDVVALIFEELKRAFRIPDTHEFSLSHIDSAADSLHDSTEKAAFAMRKLQALRHAATPGEPTSNAVVVTLVADLNTLLESLATQIMKSDQTAYRVLTNGRRILNAAGLVVSSLNGADVINLD